MHTTHPTQGEPIITHNAEMTQPTQHLPSMSHTESLKAALTPPRTQHITTNKRIYKTRKPHCELNSLYAGIFLMARLPQQSLTLMANQECARRTEIDSSTQQTSLRRLEGGHTGKTRKAHCKLNSLYESILLTLSTAARPHVNFHPSECVPHSNKELYTADFTQALRVKAHRTDTESTL